MKQLRLGGATVDRVVESEGPSFFPEFIFPDWTEEAFEAERDWLAPHFRHAATGRLLMSVHAYVIRIGRHVVLVDTCIGNDKERPSTKPWHRLQTPWLERLDALGVAPEQVTHVLCTHLHVDHVGWNTRLQNGRWVPTFPNARYLFHKDEYAYWEAEARRPQEGRSGSNDGTFQDSVLPVVEAGKAELVDGWHEIDDALKLEPSVGHSPGHVCLNLASEGARACFTGDMMHHPMQIARPDWNSRFCWDPAMSAATRRRFVERFAESGETVLAAHFAAPTAGRVRRDGAGWKFDIDRQSVLAQG
jgi:glyoxylase-like metal-dependent hydrolase (beta-lactamase superfamily II)